MMQKDLAHALGITPGMVSRLAKRGMPVDSLERAQRWRKRHLEPSRIKGARFDPKAPAQQPSPPAPAAGAPDPWAALAHTIQRLAGDADAALLQSDPLDLEPLREALRYWPPELPLPPMSVRAWVALTDHAMATDSPARYCDNPGRLVTCAELQALVIPDGVYSRCGRHWLVVACDSAETVAAAWASQQAPDDDESH